MSKPKQYRKKPVVIEAMQLTDNIAQNKEVAKWCGGIFWAYGSKSIDIKTLEGTIKAQVGDYIIKGVQGEFYPCKPEIFEKTYEDANISAQRDEKKGINNEQTVQSVQRN